MPSVTPTTCPCTASVGTMVNLSLPRTIVMATLADGRLGVWAPSLAYIDGLFYMTTMTMWGSASDSRTVLLLSRVLSSGTLSDRLSALTLLAQASPVHNQRALESLKGLAQKKSREGSLKALRAIVDWWCGGGHGNVRYHEASKIAACANLWPPALVAEQTGGKGECWPFPST